MPKLKDFVANRIREVEDSLATYRRQSAEIEEKIRAAELELSELRNAARAIGIPNGLPDRPLGVTRKEKPPLTIKEAIMRVLPEYPDGLLALDLLGKINERFDLQLVRTSLSPQLTRLKRERKITNRGSAWLALKPPVHIPGPLPPLRTKGRPEPLSENSSLADPRD
jgi:hypothetical protein